jgi:anti-anti-sigma regulatory factor
MSIHVGHAHRRNYTRSMLTSQIHVNGSCFGIVPRPGAHEARTLRDEIRVALAAGSRHVIVDCEAWVEADLAVLSVLVQSAGACREHGASFTLANVSGAIHDSIRSLALEDRLRA